MKQVDTKCVFRQGVRKKNQSFLKIIKIFQMQISRKNFTLKQEAKLEFHNMFVEIIKSYPSKSY